MQEIADWLDKFGLGQYAQRFAENDISFFILPDLTDQDLEKIGIAYEAPHVTRPDLRCNRRAPKVAAALMVALKHKWRLEDKLGGKAYDGDDPKWIAAEKAEDAAWRARDAAELRLVRIKPTTPDGAIALLNYFADIGADDVPPISDRAAKSAARRSAALSPATSPGRLSA